MKKVTMQDQVRKISDDLSAVLGKIEQLPKTAENTAQRESVVESCKLLQKDISNFSEKLALLPGDDDSALETYYSYLQEQLDGFKALLDAQQYYFKKANTKNLSDQVNAYLEVVIKESKRELKVDDTYCSDSELSKREKAFESSRANFEKQSEQALNGLSSAIAKKDTKLIQAAYALYGALVDDYRAKREAAAARLHTIEIEAFKFYLVKKEQRALLQECQQLDEVIADQDLQWNPIKERALPQDSKEISKKIYDYTGDRAAKYIDAAKASLDDNAKLKEEINAKKERIEEIARARDTYEKRLEEFNTKISEELSYPDEYMLDAEFKKHLSSFELKLDALQKVDEQVTSWLDKYYATHDKAVLEIADKALQEQTKGYDTSRSSVEKRIAELKEPATKFHQAEARKNELLNQHEKLAHQVGLENWKPVQDRQLTNHYATINGKQYIPEGFSGNLVEKYAEAQKECEVDIAKLEEEIKAINQRDKDLQQDADFCRKLIAVTDKAVESGQHFDYVEEYLADYEYNALKAFREGTYPHLRSQMIEILNNYFKTHDKATLEAVTEIFKGQPESYATTKKTAESRIELLKSASAEFHKVEALRKSHYEQYTQLVNQFLNLNWEPSQSISVHTDKKYIDFGTVHPDLEKAYKSATSECLQDIEQLQKDIVLLQEEIKSIPVEQAKQTKARELLVKVHEQRNSEEETKAHLKAIKDNHKKYLEDNMISHVKLIAEGENVVTVKNYAEKMVEYHTSKADYLTSAIQKLTLTSKLGGGVLSALLGAAAGGGAFFASKGSTFWGAINPLEGAKNAAAGAVSGLIGMAVSYTAYQIWHEKARKAGSDDSQAAFEAAMKEAGFTNEKYQELADDVVKLFHFRECVLLGLKDSNGTDMRKEFKTQLGGEVNDKDLNAAIEAHFLDQLNQLFTTAFGQIYDIHEDEIQKEKGRSAIRNWFVNFFEKPEDRQRFTQQLQLAFMEQTLNYLKLQMNEPGFLKKHPYFIASVSGLMAGTIVLGVAATVLGGPVGLGILSIALIITCLTALLTYLLVTRVESYKRSKDNREALAKDIELVTQEKERLELLMKTVTDTSVEDLKQLQAYEVSNDATWSSWFGLSDEANVAMGAGLAWVREYASRYRHSKFVELELQDAHKEVIANADEQTKLMQGLLVEMMSSNTIHPDFAKFIKDTETYLKDDKNAKFIKNFELISKIKEQILQIVAAVPLDSKRPLPKELVTFYTQTLHGSAQDLDAVRRISPLVMASTELEGNAPYQSMKAVASSINEKAIQVDDKHILGGDDNYRVMLGLSRREEKIDKHNIDNYLNDSYVFLLSLLEHEKEPAFDKEYGYSDAFTLYRTLLIKQLATLADPNNPGITKDVHDKVMLFAKNILGIDNPRAVFNQAICQGLLSQGNDEKLYPQHIADATVTGLTYNLRQVTPKALVERELEDFLLVHANETRLFYGNSNETLIPENTQDYAAKVEGAIKSTQEFIAAMEQRPLLKSTHAADIYRKGVIAEIDTLLAQIAVLKEKAGKEADTKYLDNAATKLKAYQERLAPVVVAEKEEDEAALNEELGDEALLGQFIKDVAQYVEKHSKINAPFFKNGEDKAAKELLDVLKDLKDGKEVHALPTIAEKGELQGIVSKHLEISGYKSLEELCNLQTTSDKEHP